MHTTNHPFVRSNTVHHLIGGLSLTALAAALWFLPAMPSAEGVVVYLVCVGVPGANAWSYADWLLNK